MEYPVTCTSDDQKAGYVMEVRWRLTQRMKALSGPEAQTLYEKVETQIGAELPTLLSAAKAEHSLVTMKVLEDLTGGITYPSAGLSDAQKLLYLEAIEEALRRAHNIEGAKFRNGDPPYDGLGGEALFRYYQSTAGWHGQRSLILSAEMSGLRRSIERADEWQITDKDLDDLAALVVARP